MLSTLSSHLDVISEDLTGWFFGSDIEQLFPDQTTTDQGVSKVSFPDIFNFWLQKGLQKLFYFTGILIPT